MKRRGSPAPLLLALGRLGDRVMRPMNIAAGFLALLAIGSTAAARQPPKQARIGMLCATSCTGGNFPAFWDEMGKLGWVEGKTIIVDRKGAEMRNEGLPQLAAELVQSKPDLILAIAPVPARAAKN